MSAHTAKQFTHRARPEPDPLRDTQDIRAALNEFRDRRGLRRDWKKKKAVDAR